ncbi:MAG: hypothetical protein NXY57DRAFT_310859 [Lentinula lateritia]|nr:MAG: hypothetical protein NXY57DRAFT_310859 [Lentinula lateritia]
MKYHIMTATPGAVAILLSVASSVIQVYAAAIPSASSPPGKFPDDLDIPSTSATPHIQSLPSVSVRNTPPTAVSSSLESTNPMRVNSIILMETRTREYDYLTPRRLDGQKKSSSKNMPLETETKEEEGKGKGEDLKGSPSLKKPLKQQKVETYQQRLEREQLELLAERQRMKAAIPKQPQQKLVTKKTTPTTPNVTKVPEKKKNLNNPLVNPIINNIVYGNQNGPSFSRPKNQKSPDA